jgi:hypothetical protein
MEHEGELSRESDGRVAFRRAALSLKQGRCSVEIS